MESDIERLRVGPYRLVRPLDGGVIAERWMALHEQTLSTHLAYRFTLKDERVESRRFLSALESLEQLRHPHLLPVEKFALGGASAPGAWVVTPFTGNLDGLVTLSSLLQQKGGRMPANEVERAILQLLEAVEFSHEAGHVHGPMRADEVLVDPRGSLSIEFYGLRRRMAGMMERTGPDAAKDEIRSIVEIAYLLVTGLSADEPRIKAERLVARLDRRWDDWFDAGLDPLGGFSSAGEAAAMLPSNRRDLDFNVKFGGVKFGPVKTVIGRVRRALRVD
jgi:serine/threonine protein kinase